MTEQRPDVEHGPARGMSETQDVTAIRPDAGGPARYVGLLRVLAGQLAETDVGLEAISGWLKTVGAEVGLRDVVLVVEGSTIGRQVFTASGGVLDGGRVERLVRHASAGLYTDPAVRLDDEEVATAVRLCRMAFELDVNRAQSMRDALTGLYNRRGYEVELARWADNAVRYGWPFTLALVDIDRFKQINDRWGHAVGDEVLERIGHEVAQQLRSGDVAARIGGDEFALILSGAAPGAVDTLIGRLDERLAEADLPCSVGLSWGRAACPSQTTDPAELYRLADERLYEDKREVAGAR